MSNANFTITIDYKSPNSTEILNRFNYPAITPGIYSGGTLSSPATDTLRIAEFTAYIKSTTNDVLVKVTSDGNHDVDISSSQPYVVMSYTWLNQQNNTVSFSAKAEGELLSTDIVFGMAEYSGATIVDFIYSKRTHNINVKSSYSGLTIDKTYLRSDQIKVKSSSNRTILCLPTKIGVVINDKPYFMSSFNKIEVELNTTTYWDTISVTNWTIASNRAGKDFYIYACVPTYGETFDIVLSANSTYPVGFTASNSRKIGGFHCLCVSVNTNVYGYINEGKDAEYLENMFADGSTVANGDTYHWLKNFVQGDILPLSCWDLIHRPNENADVEGKVYDPKTNLWVDIYLPSWNAGLSKLLSVYEGTIADGASSPAFHWYRFSQVFTNQGQRLPRQDHFVSCSLGSPQGVQISTGADPVTTGGKTASNNLRIISNIGIEDATGILWQWGSEGGTNTATAYSNAYDNNDKNVGGQGYSDVTRPFFGGFWGGGVGCGSRGSGWAYVGLSLNAGSSGRGFAEPK